MKISVCPDHVVICKTFYTAGRKNHKISKIWSSLRHSKNKENRTMLYPDSFSSKNKDNFKQNTNTRTISKIVTRAIAIGNPTAIIWQQTEDMHYCQNRQNWCTPYRYVMQGDSWRFLTICETNINEIAIVTS